MNNAFTTCALCGFTSNDPDFVRDHPGMCPAILKAPPAPAPTVQTFTPTLAVVNAVLADNDLPTVAAIPAPVPAGTPLVIDTTS